MLVSSLGQLMLVDGLQVARQDVEAAGGLCLEEHRPLSDICDHSLEEY